MNLLLEDHLIEIALKDKRLIRNQACWKCLSCSKVLCPAHGLPSIECWLIPKTHCADDAKDDFFQKISSCITCSYFKTQGELHPQGWNFFLSEQIHQYNVKALEHIYQKEESFVEILNRIPDGLFTTDFDWRITYINPAAEKITGFSAHDAVGMYCKDVFKNPICESDCALKHAIAEGRDIHNREYEITSIEGKKIPIICSTSPFRDAAGRVTGGLEIFKDISELKQLQEEVAKREKKYRRIFEGSHDMIYTTNQQGQILDINQAGVEMLNYPSKEEMLKTGSAQNLYRNTYDRDRFLAAINRRGQVKDYEVEFRKRDGAAMQALISSRRYQNPETGDVEFEGIIKDITHRKRTEEALKQRNRELSILNSIAVALNHNMALNLILEETLKNVLKILELNRGAIFLIDREREKTEVIAKFGFTVDGAEDTQTVFFKDPLLSKALVDDEMVLKPEPIFPTFKARFELKAQKFSPWLTCFLITFKGKGVGFLGLDIPSARKLSQYEFHLMGSLGNFLGGAIVNAQMRETIRRNQQELRRLTGKLFQSQEEERRRIARELHDESGQSLTAVKLALERLEQNVPAPEKGLRHEIGEIIMMVRRTSSEIRRLSYHLHPTLLSDLGLEPALDLYFKEIKNHTGHNIEFSMVGFDHRLDVDMETVFYRFSQEALTNALKHSGSDNFRLSIIKSYPKIIFRAADDGIGFDTQIIGTDKRNLGLLGMRERTSLLGGTFQLRSKPGEGTRIRIEIPFAESLGHG
ncbi:Two-component system sensor histidine kinase [Olavius sp. associated proteobacterium Delta 1]|nr:Two-component system sensor histidine kinase [Olavius sp. associated proteobacterium Delta 1]